MTNGKLRYKVGVLLDQQLAALRDWLMHIMVTPLSKAHSATTMWAIGSIRNTGTNCDKAERMMFV